MIPIRNVYYLLCYAWGYLDEADLVDRSELDRLDRVEDLFGKVLAEGTFTLLRRGLDRGYRGTTQEIAGVRGKLEIGAMATTAVRARSRTICTFEEFTPDILHNQILRSTLRALLGSVSLDASVRRDVALAYQKLEGVRTIRVSRQAFRRVQLDRSKRHYRFLLQLCRLIHEMTLVSEDEGSVKFRDFRRSKKVMWRLFEGFVREFYRVEQNVFRVLPERKIQWSRVSGRTPTDEAYIPEMYSDVLLEGASRRIILDTKFYGQPTSRRQGTEKLRSGNLYQLLAYLENRQSHLPEGPRHEGLLLYASVDGALAVDITLNGFRIQALTIDLSKPFQAIRRNMLALLGVVTPAVGAPEA